MNGQTELFPVIKNKNTCGKCIHIFQHDYNKTKYCKMFLQKNTSYGYKKVKSKQSACQQFER